VETAERPLRESRRLRAVSAPGLRLGVLKRSDSPLAQPPGPLAAAKRIITAGPMSILETDRPSKRG
jgi:hypothetical protein